MDYGWIPNIIQTGLIGWGVWIAHSGLTTWRKQMIDSQDHDLARKLLRSTLEFRDAVQRARNSFVSNTEINAAAESAGLPEGSAAVADSVREIHKTVRREVYYKRCECIAHARLSLETLILEAEVVWDWKDDAADVFTSLWRIQSDLWFAISMRFDPDWDDLTNEMSSEERKENRETIYARNTPNHPDKLAIRLDDAVGKIKSQVGPKLMKNSRKKSI